MTNEKTKIRALKMDEKLVQKADSYIPRLRNKNRKTKPKTSSENP